MVTLPSLLLSTPTAVSSPVAAFLSNCNSISPFLPIAVGAHPHAGCDACPAHPPLVLQTLTDADLREMACLGTILALS